MASNSADFNAAARAAVISVAVLFGKQFVTSFGGAVSRMAAGRYYNAEDNALVGVAFKHAKVGDMSPASETEALWRRIQNNDWENIPLYFAILLLNLVVAPTQLAGVPFWVYAFTGSRVAWTIFYALRLQPFRTVAWFGGFVSTIMLLLNLLSATAKY